MKLVGGANILWSAKPDAGTSKKSIFKFYIGSFLCIYCDGSVKQVKLRATEKLLTNEFGHNVKQPSSWRRQSLRWPIKTFVYPWRRLTAMSHDQSVYEVNNKSLKSKL